MVTIASRHAGKLERVRNVRVTTAAPATRMRRGHPVSQDETG